MSEPLHRAIRDALRDASGYRERGILVGTFLDATHHLDADDTILYRSVYTIFRAMPDRIMRGSTLNIATSDAENGIELRWNCSEEGNDVGNGRDLRALLGTGPNGDLMGIALMALHSFCNMRAGYVDVKRDAVASSSSFLRPAYVHRRVIAFIPVLGTGGGEGSGIQERPSARAEPPSVLHAARPRQGMLRPADAHA